MPSWKPSTGRLKMHKSYGSDRTTWLHNMSAPPRSKVTIAGHRKPRMAIGISLDMTCIDTAFIEQALGVSTKNTLLLNQRIKAILSPLKLAPIEPILPAWGGPHILVNPCTAIAILSQSTRLFYMFRREPDLAPRRLNRTVYLSKPLIITQLGINAKFRRSVLDDDNQLLLIIWITERYK
jgi:hypothetical protein